MKIFILGRTEYLYDTAVKLSAAHDICRIITADAMPEYSKNENDFRLLAEKMNCPFLHSNTINAAVKNAISESGADICISLNWKTVLKEDVISLFPHGILNAHFGDLPSYRGNAVINWAILNGEKKITITIHQMTPGEIDSGVIWKKLDMPINDDTQIGEITDFCKKNTPLLFNDVVDGIDKGTIQPVEQLATGIAPSRCYPRLPEYSKINWGLPAADIHALIRASAKPYSGAYSYIRSEGAIKKIYVWKSRLVKPEIISYAVPGHIIKNDPDSGESIVFTGNGLIAISLVQFEGGEEFEPGKTWKSIRMHFGVEAEEELLLLQNKLKEHGIE